MSLGVRESRGVAQQRMAETSDSASEFIAVFRPLLPEASRILPYLRLIDEKRIYSNYGPLSIELSCRLADTLALPRDGVTCTGSGTAALIGAILASAGRATPERPLAILPALTFTATALAAEQCGYQPYIVDVDPSSWTLDAESLIEHPAREQAGIVIPVAPFGRAVAQAPWSRFQAKTGIPVVIDGAASFVSLAAEPSRFLGTVPVAISFHATKAFATGEGGAVATSNVEQAARISKALNFGMTGVRDCSMPGTNGKMSEYHAAVGLAELDDWPEKLRNWLAVAEAYRRQMSDAGITASFYAAPEIAPNYALFRCRMSSTAGHVADTLTEHGIDFRFWYGAGVHRQTYYGSLSRDALPNAEELASCLFGLPVAPDLPTGAIARVVEAVAIANSR